MKDSLLIEEIKELFRATDYPGSSLNCGVYPLFYNNCKSTALYYPAKKCILFSDNTLIKHVHSFKHAERILRKIYGHNTRWDTYDFTRSKRVH